MLLLEEIFAGIDEGLLRNEAHDLGTRDADATVLSAAAHLVEGHMQRGNVQVGHVHRHLCNAILIDEPADGLGAFQCAGLHDGITLGIFDDFTCDGIALAEGATLLAHVEGDGISATRRGGVEVIVDGNEEVACTYCCAACAGHVVVDGACPEVRLLALGRQFLGQCLVFTLAADGQVLALWCEGCGLVAVAGDAQFGGDALCQLAGQGGTLLEGDASHGNERQHVGGTHARMGSVVLTHIDELTGLAHTTEGSLHHLVGRTDKGDNGTVGSLTWVYI